MWYTKFHTHIQQQQQQQQQLHYCVYLYLEDGTTEATEGNGSLNFIPEIFICHCFWILEQAQSFFFLIHHLYVVILSAFCWSDMIIYWVLYRSASSPHLASNRVSVYFFILNFSLTSLIDTGFQVFTMCVAHIIVFWILTPCSIIGLFWHFRAACCHHLHCGWVLFRWMIKWLYGGNKSVI